MSSEPRQGEIWATITQLKNSKGPDVDAISAELLKLGEETVVKWLTHLAVCLVVT